MQVIMCITCLLTSNMGGANVKLWSPSQAKATLLSWPMSVKSRCGESWGFNGQTKNVVHVPLERGVVAVQGVDSLSPVLCPWSDAQFDTTAGLQGL